ncbi:MAG: hypothetical protein H7A38_04775 [Chlamydiales bacterium]|nr:hypothetical protein [Chlamydiales bacterium]
MLKKLKSTLIINAIGFALLMVCLYGYQGFMSSVQGVSHEKVVVDEDLLKERLSLCSTAELEEMLAAGLEVEEWNQMLRKTGSHVVSEVLKGQGVFTTMEHYPLSDTFDGETYSQYYYHAHRGGEHGHFHLFLRQGGMEIGTIPILYDERNQKLDNIQTFAHLIAISMDDQGIPIGLFTVNRWVTGEDWYAACDLKKMVQRFSVNHAHPSYVVNRWLKAMLILFLPQIHDLIDARDKVLQSYQKGVPLKAVLEDQELDVLSEEKISIETQIKLIKMVLEERGQDAPKNH